MYSNKKDSMTISVQVYMWHKKTTTEALLDSGATHNFIDRCAVEKIGLGVQNLKQPRLVNNVDGTLNQEGSITQYCNLWVKQGSTKAKLGFYIANLGRDRIILGHPWFKAFNPQINWTTNQLDGEEVILETARYQSKATI
jgi:Retroviral aspartyl protease